MAEASHPSSSSGIPLARGAHRRPRAMWRAGAQRSILRRPRVGAGQPRHHAQQDRGGDPGGGRGARRWHLFTFDGPARRELDLGSPAVEPTADRSNRRVQRAKRTQRAACLTSRLMGASAVSSLNAHSSPHDRPTIESRRLELDPGRNIALLRAQRPDVTGGARRHRARDGCQVRTNSGSAARRCGHRIVCRLKDPEEKPRATQPICTPKAGRVPELFLRARRRLLASRC